MKKLISILMMLMMLGMVNGLYWSTAWDNDQDGINDFNLMGNPYYTNVPEGCVYECTQWYWCEDNSVWSLKDGVQNPWEVEDCLDACHSTRTYQTSAMDPSKFVDVTWCGSEVAITDVSDCDYPYGMEAFCGGDYGLNENKLYFGYCSYYELWKDCYNCDYALDGTPTCLNMDWAYCLNEKVGTGSVVGYDETYEYVFYWCDYRDDGDCSNGLDNVLRTIKVFPATSTQEIVKNQCLEEATALEEAQKSWYFDPITCGCAYRAPHIGETISYTTSDDCLDANSEAMSNDCEGEKPSCLLSSMTSKPEWVFDKDKCACVFKTPGIVQDCYSTEVDCISEYSDAIESNCGQGAFVDIPLWLIALIFIVVIGFFVVLITNK